MNNASLFSLEEKNNRFLKQYGLDEESIEKFKKSIAIVSKMESDKLGKELYELIAKKGYSDNDGRAVDLIKRGANVLYKNDKKGDYALLVCARKGYFETFKALIKAGADVNQVNNYFTTALMAAARHGRVDMVKILILLKADINARCLDGDSAIISAKRHNQKACFLELMNANASLTTKNLANETFLDVPGDVSFDSELLENRGIVISSVVTADDTKNLINEAKEKVKRMFPNK